MKRTQTSFLNPLDVPAKQQKLSNMPVNPDSLGKEIQTDSAREALRLLDQVDELIPLVPFDLLLALQEKTQRLLSMACYQVTQFIPADIWEATISAALPPELTKRCSTLLSYGLVCHSWKKITHAMFMDTAFVLKETNENYLRYFSGSN